MSLVYVVRPISDRAPFTGKHEHSQFTASWSDTLDLLERELSALAAMHVAIEVDVPERAIRADGMLRADAKVSSPAVRLAFDSRFGSLQYATDRFVRPSWRREGAREDWQHNLRAIALSLEALRRVDRYGITKRGEQYAGWKALPAGESAIAMPTALTIEQAAQVLIDLAEAEIASADPVKTVITEAGLRLGLYRRAARRLHPDVGGDPALWARLSEAKQVIDQNGGVR